MGGNRLRIRFEKAFGQGERPRKVKVSSKQTGKKEKDKVPSWATGVKPYAGQSGKEYATFLCDMRYGKGNYKKGPGTEHSKIQKHIDRDYKNPPGWGKPTKNSQRRK